MEENIHKGEVILYHPNETVKLEVRLENETVWLSVSQMSLLFDREESNIRRHILNIFKEKELEREGNVHNLHVPLSDKPVPFYSLDIIISVGYRVKSNKGTQFRRWANTILKEYLLNGFSINSQLIQLEQRLDSKLLSQHDEIMHIKQIQIRQQEQIDLYIKTNDTPKEHLFGNGCVFDAWNFVSNLIRSAEKEIVLIDNYVDDTVLAVLSKRKEGVKATIHTRYTTKFVADLEKYNKQFSESEIDFIQLAHKNHDRFLIIDDDVYMLGNSVKDFGNTWGVVIKMEMSKHNILSMLGK